MHRVAPRSAEASAVNDSFAFLKGSLVSDKFSHFNPFTPDSAKPKIDNFSKNYKRDKIEKKNSRGVKYYLAAFQRMVTVDGSVHGIKGKKTLYHPRFHSESQTVNDSGTRSYAHMGTKKID